ncbi:MAG: pyridoxal phosphate biosynthesis PdxJ family protein [Candidatus Xenolissoclinum pacificiensis L6]|uniref:Pyridoxal phosphate biosynthesis PdxJ family protein n=1 Tax=Candidatus Xenolissoclinum pacificiensis L6 TaxID=1401685 RepID=W2V0D5_9RICK|nr:MAG: pyridoxal phosphate biosynthesis PdxJ family protein [Candidatus Xenolissoclinum pacificiensis L6]
MVELSVNIDKLALLRNSRGFDYPSLVSFVESLLRLGIRSITMHPRRDFRHILLSDIDLLRNVFGKQIIINVETDIDQNVIDAVVRSDVDRILFVPCREQERTTERGFSKNGIGSMYRAIVEYMKSFSSCEMGFFVDFCYETIDIVSDLNVDYVEFNTTEYSELSEGKRYSYIRESMKPFVDYTKGKSVKVHLGHGLNTSNLSDLIKDLNPREVSVGHALFVESIFAGMNSVISTYKNIINN